MSSSDSVIVKFLYCVMDLVASEIAGPIMVFANDNAARRSFQEAVFGQESFLAKHPDDYVLVCLGTIDMGTGAIVSFPYPHEIVTARLVIDVMASMQGTLMPEA